MGAAGGAVLAHIRPVGDRDSQFRRNIAAATLVDRGQLRQGARRQAQPYLQYCFARVVSLPMQLCSALGSVPASHGSSSLQEATHGGMW